MKAIRSSSLSHVHTKKLLEPDTRSQYNEIRRLCSVHGVWYTTITKDLSNEGLFRILSVVVERKI